MAKPASRTVIGAFVIGAVVLGLGLVVALGSGRLFKRTLHYVLYFQGSVKGLQDGAPVIFRGVRIGRVTDIAMRLDPRDLSVFIPVTIEIDPSKITLPEDMDRTGFVWRARDFYQPLLQKGLKGRLEMQSYLTGLLVVNLDFYPGKPTVMRGDGEGPPEIPTVPGPLQEWSERLQDLNLEETVRKLAATVDGLHQLASSGEIKRTQEALLRALASFETFAGSADLAVRNTDARLEVLTARMEESLGAARGAFEQLERTLTLREGEAGVLADELKATLASARAAMARTEAAAGGAGRLMEGAEDLPRRLERTLDEFSTLARALRELADYLDQHPEALLRGKKGEPK